MERGLLIAIWSRHCNIIYQFLKDVLIKTTPRFDRGVVGRSYAAAVVVSSLFFRLGKKAILDEWVLTIRAAFGTSALTWAVVCPKNAFPINSIMLNMANLLLYGIPRFSNRSTSRLFSVTSTHPSNNNPGWPKTLYDITKFVATMKINLIMIMRKS